MPPNNIVRDVRTVVEKLLMPQVPKKWKHQFSFGLQAYSLKPFQSAAGNSRSVISNPHTAATKAERLLANDRLVSRIGSIMDALKLVRQASFINIDHSEMNGLMVLAGAAQTRKGRSIPVMIESVHSDRLPSESSSRATPRKSRLRRDRAEARRSQSFTGHVIDSLQDFHDRLGFWPKLVFDRGFGNESIVTHLSAEGANFYIRLKAGRFVEFDGQKTEVKQLKEKNAVIQLFGLKLRVIRSPKSRRAKEPWYILTNDFRSSRNKIVKIYYHRFEIEETFRDMKHIWELKRTRLNKPASLKTILWFVALGMALLWITTKPTIKELYKGNPNKQSSWLRQAYELFQQGLTEMVWGEGWK